MAESGPLEVTQRFFGSYAEGNIEGAAMCLAERVVAYVTDAEGASERVVGRSAYVGRVPDLKAAGGSLVVTQALGIDERTSLTMVEIRARREGRQLHNFAAFLARVEGDEIVTLWMVDARPAESDQFWA